MNINLEFLPNTASSLNKTVFLSICHVLCWPPGSDISHLTITKNRSDNSKWQCVYLHAIFLHAAAGFEVGADAFASTLLELWELTAAGFNNGLDLLFRLFRDWHHTVQVLIHKQTHKHLNKERKNRSARQIISLNEV